MDNGCPPVRFRVRTFLARPVPVANLNLSHSHSHLSLTRVHVHSFSFGAMSALQQSLLAVEERHSATVEDVTRSAHISGCYACKVGDRQSTENRPGTIIIIFREYVEDGPLTLACMRLCLR